MRRTTIALSWNHGLRTLAVLLAACTAITPVLAAAVIPAARSTGRAASSPAKRAVPRASFAAPVDLSVGLPAWRFPVPVERTLPNGLRVAVFQNTRLPQVQIQLMVPAGGIEEAGAPIGLAYLTSQLVRQSTSSRSSEAITAEFERLGGHLAVAASRDNATLAASFLARDFESGLELVSDIVINPLLSEEDFGRTRSEAQRSLGQLRMNSGAVADEHIWSITFVGHPYGRAPFGTLESVAAITREQARTFYRDHWRPDRALLVIGGDVTPERAFAAAEEWFGRWNGKAVAPAPTLVQVLKSPRIRVIDRPEASATELRIGLLLPPATSTENVALSLATSLLGAGPTARLQVPEVRRRFGRELRTTLLQLRDGGLFTCGSMVRTDSVGSAIRFLREQLREFGAHAPAEADLERSRRVALNTLPMPFETMSGVVSEWMGIQFLGQGRSAIDDLPARIAAVSPSEIKEVARRWLNPDQAAIVLVGPAESLRSQLEGLGTVEVVKLDALRATRASFDTVAATPERLRQGREVLDRALAAHGGIETLRGIHDSISDADITLSSAGQQFSGHMNQVRKEPYRMAYFTRFETLESTQVLDGFQAWSLAGGATSVENVDSVGVFGLRTNFRSDPSHLLIDAAAARVVYQGGDQVGGADVDVLNVSLADGTRRRYYFDRNTHLLCALDEVGGDGTGQSLVSRRVFRDYRATQGVQWPFLEERLLDNEPAMRMEVKSLKLNSGVDDKVFGKPKPEKSAGP